MTFKKMNTELHNELLRGIDFHITEHEPETPFFDADNIRKLLCKAKTCGIDILGIECWTSNRLDYFTTVCRDIYVSSRRIPESQWADSALEEIMNEYGEKVLEKFPDDKPLFAVEFRGN
ncbi:MAG: hypothetical protein AB7E48_08295 [Deferribacterales bacterium]